MKRSRSHLTASATIASALALITACSGGTGDLEESTPLSEHQYTEEQLVTSCVEFRERACQCRQELLEPWLDLRARTNPALAEAMATESGREEIKRIALREFVEDGSGPLEPRRRKCEAMLDSGERPDARSVTDIAACAARESCADWIACIMPIMEKMMAPKSR